MTAAQGSHDLTPEQRMALFQQTMDGRVLNPLVTQFLAPALAVAQRILAQRALAEDAVQEAFLRVIRAHDRYDPAQPFSSWFYTILRNVCIDVQRQHQRQQAATRDYATQARAPSTPQVPPSTDGLPLLETLPAEERDVLTLRIVSDLPFADIAAALGISVEAAKKRAQRALQRLRDRMGPDGTIPEKAPGLSPPPGRGRIDSNGTGTTNGLP